MPRVELGDLVLNPGVKSFAANAIELDADGRVSGDQVDAHRVVQQQPENLEEAVGGGWVVALPSTMFAFAATMSLMWARFSLATGLSP